MNLLSRRPVAMKLIPLLLVTVALAATPSLVAFPGSNGYAHPLSAKSVATSSGVLSVLWGDPYLPARMNQGSGNETLTAQGYVTPRSDLPGAYTYTYPSTAGELEAQWSTPNETYIVDVYFNEGHSPYNRTTIFPAANSFAAMYIYFSGELTVNGVTSEIKGLAALVAAAPGYFSFHGTARATYIILYPQTYHGNQYIFRWSQTDQIINGLEQPKSETVSQTVDLT